MSPKEASCYKMPRKLTSGKNQHPLKCISELCPPPPSNTEKLQKPKKKGSLKLKLWYPSGGLLIFLSREGEGFKGHVSSENEVRGLLEVRNWN